MTQQEKQQLEQANVVEFTPTHTEQEQNSNADDNTPGTCDTAQIIIEIKDTSKGFEIRVGTFAESKPTHPLAIMTNHLRTLLDGMMASQGCKLSE